MDPSDAPLKYTKMTGFATTHGQEFEWTLAALLHLRGLNSGVEFQLGTNVKDAGALDDIVFRYQHDGAWRTMYVQLKHKGKKWLSRKMLVNSRGDFSLPSYFKSYLEIRKAMSSGKKQILFDGTFEDCLFVIFTDAKGNDDLGEKRSEDFSQGEEFLWTGTGSVFSLENDKEILECLGECGDAGIQFLNQLRVFCGQPSASKLKEAVREELQEIQNTNIDRLCENFLGSVKAWWETSNDIVHKGYNILESALNRVSLESCSEQTLKEYKMEVSFEDAAFLELNNMILLYAKSPVTHVVSSEKTSRLTLTKLWQATAGQALWLKAEHLAANKRALLAECLNGNVKRLVVCASSDWNLEFTDEYFNIFNDILTRRDNISVTFLTERDDSQISPIFATVQERFASFADNFIFSQLTEASRREILDRKVDLQGHHVPLRKLLGKGCDSFNQVLTASIVVEILSNVGPLIVGSALPEGIGHYVERKLELPCVKPSVFQALEGTVTVRVTQNDASDRGLFVRALEFLSSLKEKDFPSINYEDMRHIINELLQSPLYPDKNDCQVFIGPKFAFKFYESNCVGLRFGKENAVVALRVCPSKEASLQVSVLFVSYITSEDDAGIMSAFYQSRNLVCLKDGQLRLIHSNGNFYSIRNHINKDQVSRLSPETVMDVEDRLVLVCAEPGMGKSTLMARLAKNTKAALPHYFVILLSLNDHAKLFAEGKHADVLDFLSIAAKMDSTLQKSLFKFALEVSGNVVVIADGFDEIAPRYVNECCLLLSRLLEETNASKIWMTSRNSVKQIIEAHASKFSAKISEFYKRGQKKFFQSFWSKRSILSEIELDEFIDNLLEKSSKAIRDEETNFLGIPLQCQMLAEVFDDHVNGSANNTTLPCKLDLFSLMEMFVKKKCDVYIQTKMKIPFDDTNYEEQCVKERQLFIDSHSKAGLWLILGDDGLKTLGMEQIIEDSFTFCKKIQHGKDKTGFVDEIENGKPRFIHRVFAEYFVASWISQHLADSAELIKSKMFTADFSVIRHIFNGILCKGSALHFAVLHENSDLVRTLLERDDIDVEAQDAGGRTALHLAAGLGTSEDREENQRRGMILDLILGKTRDFKLVDSVLCGSPLQYADISRTWVAIDKLLRKTENNGELVLTLKNLKDDNMLDIIFQQDLDKLLELCLDKGLPVEHQMDSRSWGEGRLLVRVCKQGSLKVASLLIERNANINQMDDDNEVGFTEDKVDDEDEEEEYEYDKEGAREFAPLIAASYNGHLEIVKLLLQKYVSNVNSTQGDGTSHVTNYLETSK